jgi:hypothetical protein
MENLRKITNAGAGHNPLREKSAHDLPKNHLIPRKNVLQKRSNNA